MLETLVGDGSAVLTNMESFSIRFSEAMGIGGMIADGSIERAVRIVKLDAGGAVESHVPLAASEFGYDGATDTLSWSSSGGSLGSGNYELQLDSTAIADLAGNALDGAGGAAVWFGLPLFDAAQPVQADAANVDVDAYSVPSIVDWDQDGAGDLIVGGLDGKVRLYENQGAPGAPDFPAESLIQDGASDLVGPEGRASVAVYDLNADGRKNLILGDTEGQVLFYRNVGTDASPAFDGHERIEADGVPIDLDGVPRSRPWVGDANGDAVPDLLVGAYDGLVRLYAGQPNADNHAVTFAVDADAPTIASWHSAADHDGIGEVLLEIPDDGSFSEPRDSGLSRLRIAFSEPIDPASPTPGSVEVYGLAAPDNTPVGLQGVTVSTQTDQSDTVAVIAFTGGLPEDSARYLVSLTGVTDAAGNPLAGDNDRIMTALLGDVTGDLRVNNVDVAVIKSLRGADPIAAGSVWHVRSDVNRDGLVDKDDLTPTYGARGNDARFISDPAPPVPPTVLAGDADMDGDVDGSDFRIVMANLGTTGAGSQQGDFDLNGIVGVADYLLLKRNLGRTLNTPQSCSVVEAPVAASQDDTPAAEALTPMPAPLAPPVDQPADRQTDPLGVLDPPADLLKQAAPVWPSQAYESGDASPWQVLPASPNASLAGAIDIRESAAQAEPIVLSPQGSDGEGLIESAMPPSRLGELGLEDRLDLLEISDILRAR